MKNTTWLHEWMDTEGLSKIQEIDSALRDRARFERLVEFAERHAAQRTDPARFEQQRPRRSIARSHAFSIVHSPSLPNAPG